MSSRSNQELHGTLVVPLTGSKQGSEKKKTNTKTFCTICTVYLIVHVCVSDDRAVCVTPTPAVLTPACSDILRRIQGLRSQSTYSVLVSLPHRGWTGVSMCVWMSAVNIATITDKIKVVLGATCKRDHRRLERGG